MTGHSSHAIWQETCDNVSSKRPLVSIDSRARIEEGCEILIKNRISSAPVFDEAANKYIGMADFRDFVDFLLIALKKKQPSSTNTEEDTKVADIVRTAVCGIPVPIKYASGIPQK